MFPNMKASQNEQMDEGGSIEKKKKKRKVINWLTWKPFYLVYDLIFGKSKVEIVMEKIRAMCKLNELRFKPREKVT